MQHNLLIMQKEGPQVTRNPAFLYAALVTTAGAAFINESRMNSANVTKLRRKTGGTHQLRESRWV
jgi:myo-inositol-1-phosphate synthase